MKHFDLSLYLIVDSQGNSKLNLIEIVHKAVKGGVTMVQLREKQASAHARKELGLALKIILKPFAVPLIVNDDPELANEVAAEGVHLGPSDCSASYARTKLGKSAIIGLSVETLNQLKQADLGNVDYVAASPVFSTPSKPDTNVPLGIANLCRFKSTAHLPVVAIGGIQLENVRGILSTGVNGVAVLSAICQSTDPYLATCNLRSVISFPNHKPPPPKRVLSIAGSDSGGGAGIQADLKTFQSLGCYGMSAITAITSQNTLGVKKVLPVPCDLVLSQIDAVVSDIGVDAVKIGMLFSSEIIESVAQRLRALKQIPIVVDPVAVAKGGSQLLLPSAVDSLKAQIFPLATVLTPNLPEAEMLTGIPIASSSDAERAGRLLLQHCNAVLIKGGHASQTDAVSDYFIDKLGNEFWLTYPRISTKNTHGTGCTYSSAIAAYLARGFTLESSIRCARNYLQGAILKNSQFTIGSGNGPVNHAWQWMGDIA